MCRSTWVYARDILRSRVHVHGCAMLAMMSLTALADESIGGVSGVSGPLGTRAVGQASLARGGCGCLMMKE